MVDIVLGAFYGDEGKGKVIDYISKDEVFNEYSSCKYVQNSFEPLSTRFPPSQNNSDFSVILR